MTDPIVIVCMPRSGSSMVAGAFVKHGVWAGTCRPPDKRNPRGYFENQPITELIGATCGHLVNGGVSAPKVPDWRGKVERVVRDDGYRSGPWLWKGSALYAPLWHEFDPTWVVVRRSLDAIKRSSKSSGYHASERSVRAHIRVMDHLEAAGAAVVDAAAVVAGDLTSLTASLERAGVQPDMAVLKEWVEPEHWRHGG